VENLKSGVQKPQTNLGCGQARGEAGRRVDLSLFFCGNSVVGVCGTFCQTRPTVRGFGERSVNQKEDLSKQRAWEVLGQDGAVRALDRTRGGLQKE